MASGIRGTSKLRRTLRRVDPSIVQGVRDVVREGAQAVTADAINLAPRDEGDLVRSIDYKLGRDGLTAVIGPGAKAAELKRRRSKSKSAFGRLDKKGREIRLSRTNRDLYFQFLKGYWIEFGTKGSKNVPPQPARPFMGPAWDLNRAWLIGRSRNAVRTALELAARV